MQIGVQHDRDVNAAINLKRFAIDAFEATTALPVASQAATPALPLEASTGGGKVTPARYEPGQQDGSEQEEDGADPCTRFR